MKKQKAYAALEESNAKLEKDKNQAFKEREKLNQELTKKQGRRAELKGSTATGQPGLIKEQERAYAAAEAKLKAVKEQYAAKGWTTGDKQTHVLKMMKARWLLIQPRPVKQQKPINRLLKNYGQKPIHQILL